MAYKHGREIDSTDKIAIYDANIYIGLIGKDTERKRLFQKEAEKGIRALASLWIVLELMNHSNKDAIKILHEHCKGDVIYDPEAQVYSSIYKEQSEVLAKRLEQIHLILNNIDKNIVDQAEIERALMVNSAFARSFPTNLSWDILKHEDELMRIQAGHMVDSAIKIHGESGGSQSINREEMIEGIIREHKGCLLHYVDLLKRKAPHKAVNRDNLYNDQRDWTLMFHAGRSNIYVVTNENNLLGLNVRNVYSLSKYLEMINQ